jgi:hypothetical protein
MPNRILKESIVSSDTLDQLTTEEERFFYRLLVVADDFGRFDARPAVIKGRAFPLKHDLEIPQVAEWLAALQRVELVRLYVADGKLVGEFARWEKHNVIRAKNSKFPAPSDTCPLLSASEIMGPHVRAPANKPAHVSAPVVIREPVPAPANTCEQMSADANTCKHTLSYTDSDSDSDAYSHSDSDARAGPVSVSPAKPIEAKPSTPTAASDRERRLGKLVEVPAPYGMGGMAPENVVRVFVAWAEKYSPAAKLDPAAESTITKGFNLKFDADQCCQAVLGQQFKKHSGGLVYADGRTPKLSMVFESSESIAAGINLWRANQSRALAPRRDHGDAPSVLAPKADADKVRAILNAAPRPSFLTSAQKESA